MLCMSCYLGQGTPEQPFTPWGRRIAGLAATDLGGDALLRRNSIDCFILQSSDSVRVPRAVHRKDAKSAKKDELAHYPLTIRLMPSLISRFERARPQ
jgi:hypothetical protein